MISGCPSAGVRVRAKKENSSVRTLVNRRRSGIWRSTGSPSWGSYGDGLRIRYVCFGVAGGVRLYCIVLQVILKRIVARFHNSAVTWQPISFTTVMKIKSTHVRDKSRIGNCSGPLDFHTQKTGLLPFFGWRHASCVLNVTLEYYAYATSASESPAISCVQKQTAYKTAKRQLTCRRFDIWRTGTLITAPRHDNWPHRPCRSCFLVVAAGEYSQSFSDFSVGHSKNVFLSGSVRLISLDEYF